MVYTWKKKYRAGPNVGQLTNIGHNSINPQISMKKKSNMNINLDKEKIQINCQGLGFHGSKNSSMSKKPKGFI